MRSNGNHVALLVAAMLGIVGAGVLFAQEPTPASGTSQEPATVPAPVPAKDEDAAKIEFPDAPDPGTTAPARPSTSTSPAPAPGATAAPPAPARTGPAATEDEEEPPPDAKPRTPGVVGPTTDHFEPSEKVRADFDVSFPVDI